jgi:hypothetical protein
MLLLCSSSSTQMHLQWSRGRAKYHENNTARDFRVDNTLSLSLHEEFLVSSVEEDWEGRQSPISNVRDNETSELKRKRSLHKDQAVIACSTIALKNRKISDKEENELLKHVLQ